MAWGALEEGFDQIKLAHKPKHNLKRPIQRQLKERYAGATKGPQNATIRS
jgi:hypothetical protein